MPSWLVLFNQRTMRNPDRNYPGQVRAIRGHAIDVRAGLIPLIRDAGMRKSVGKASRVLSGENVG